jgi:hypothetical protein
MMDNQSRRGEAVQPATSGKPRIARGPRSVRVLPSRATKPNPSICASDAQAKGCANALSSATCQAPPSNCNLPDVADPAPAQKACDDLQLALCQRSDECQAGTLDACLQQIKGMIDCANAIGVMLPYESCMPEVRKLACVSPTLPTACRGIILFK